MHYSTTAERHTVKSLMLVQCVSRKMTFLIYKATSIKNKGGIENGIFFCTFKGFLISHFHDGVSNGLKSTDWQNLRHEGQPNRDDQWFLGVSFSGEGGTWNRRLLPLYDVLQDPLIIRSKHQLVVVDHTAELDGHLL